jgi:DNA-binding response OmpR family regulator
MPNEKPKILMIEEDKFLRKIYRNKFCQVGFEFLEATNGEEGINKIIAEKPDIVLLDLMLPKKSGFDVLVETKSKKETKNIPVIVLSNLAQETDIQRTISLGANDYLVKTEVSLSQVVDRVKECLVKTGAEI